MNLIKQKKKVKISFFILLISLISIGNIYCQTNFYLKEHYKKAEYRIPMRDGIKLFTSVYMPKDTSQKYPILLWRTPYSSAPYNLNKFSRYMSVYSDFVKAGYIIVFQDVRGKFMSEGKFINMRPYIPDKKTNKEVDEASDTYDTVDWLIKHIPNNNGRVGLWGISYPGFYAAMGAMSDHPAIKAVSPQAPIADWFIDDDMHHNGALSLLLSFNFFKVFGQPRDSLTTHWKRGPQYVSPDAYDFFLNMGPLSNANKKYLHYKVKFWNETMNNGVYNKFWQKRNTLQYFNNVKPAIMTVGGWFDSEDLYGTLHTYETIEKKNPGIYNILVMGPWPHGAWARGNISSFGDMNFGVNTSEFYRENIELPFFNYYLKKEGTLNLPEAYIYDTGENKWYKFNKWPPANIKKVSIYLDGNQRLSFEKPVNTIKNIFDEYLSDPNKPVPYTAKIIDSRAFYNKTYMNEDQRFAARRPDVLLYETKPLTKSFTIAGPINVKLYVSTTGTDADWVVKLIDVYPDSAKNPKPNPNYVKMGGYQMLIRGDIMRGKFRNSYEKPIPFIPGKVTKVTFHLQDVMHTFLKGHKIMIQMQSSWFPFFDRNPQTFTNIYHATQKDFVKAAQRVYHSKKYPTKIVVDYYSK